MAGREGGGVCGDTGTFATPDSACVLKLWPVSVNQCRVPAKQTLSPVSLLMEESLNPS